MALRISTVWMKVLRKEDSGGHACTTRRIEWGCVKFLQTRYITLLMEARLMSTRVKKGPRNLPVITPIPILREEKKCFKTGRDQPGSCVRLSFRYSCKERTQEGNDSDTSVRGTFPVCTFKF